MKPVFLTDSQIATLRLALASHCAETDPRNNDHADLEHLAELTALNKASADLLARLDILTTPAAPFLEYLTRLEAAGFTATSANAHHGEGYGPPVALEGTQDAARFAASNGSALIHFQHPSETAPLYLLTDLSEKPAHIIADFSERLTPTGRIFALTIEGTARSLETLSPAY